MSNSHPSDGLVLIQLLILFSQCSKLTSVWLILFHKMLSLWVLSRSSHNKGNSLFCRMTHLLYLIWHLPLNCLLMNIQNCSDLSSSCKTFFPLCSQLRHFWYRKREKYSNHSSHLLFTLKVRNELDLIFQNWMMIKSKAGLFISNINALCSVSVVFGLNKSVSLHLFCKDRGFFACWMTCLRYSW